MKYVALLRGINVGGKNKIDMKLLKQTFENIGLENVRTYINSGNIIFSASSSPTEVLASKLEAAIEKDFGLTIRVLVRDEKNIQNVCKHLPSDWTNDASTKCDVMFLWDNYDSKEVLESLTIKPGIDDVKYVAGAILWRVEKRNVTKSGMMKLIGSDLYKHMTIRNCNTVRKLHELINYKKT